MYTDRLVNAHGHRCTHLWRPALEVKMSSLIACPPYFLDMHQAVSARFIGQQPLEVTSLQSPVLGYKCALPALWWLLGALNREPHAGTRALYTQAKSQPHISHLLLKF